MRVLVVIMGVAGSGKSTVGAALARRTGLVFLDADDWHDPDDLVRMSRGTPLSDEDRQGWLDRLNQLLRRHRDEGAVLACSALSAWSRARLTDGLDDVRFVLLRGAPDLIRERLRLRQGHPVGPSLLPSQLRTLDPPNHALEVDVANPPEVIVDQIVAWLEDGSHGI